MELFDEQLEVRAMLRNQQNKSKASESVIVSTGIFMSFLFEGWFGVVVFGDQPTVQALGSWKNEVTVTTVEDIGTLIAKIALEDLETRNQIVYIAGETISYARLAEIVEHHVNRPVAKELWSVEYLKGELRKAPDNALAKYRVVLRKAKESRGPWEKHTTSSRILKLRTLSPG